MVVSATSDSFSHVLKAQKALMKFGSSFIHVDYVNLIGGLEEYVCTVALVSAMRCTRPLTYGPMDLVMSLSAQR